MKNLINFMVALLLFYGANTYAQQPSIERYVIASTGGTWTNGSNMQVDFTIGEVAVTTLNSSNNILTQGFQQPMEDGVFINEVDEGIIITFFPNPVKDFLMLQILNAEEQNFDIELYDLLGQLVVKYPGVTGNSGTSVFTYDMKSLAPGTYFIHVAGKNSFIKNFKILKISS